MGALLALGAVVGGVEAGAHSKDNESKAATASKTVLAGGRGGGSVALAPLSTVPIPQPVGSDIINQAAAIRLGKALFWDSQTGSDGQVACATCHFQAGGDSRLMNVVNPGPNNLFECGVKGAGELFTLHDVDDDDRVGSQGVVGGTFTAIPAKLTDAADLCTPDLAMPWGPNRRVTGRNTPQAVGAIFNRQNFWDGRANDQFNGIDPFGGTGNSNSLITANATPLTLATVADDKGGSGKGSSGKGSSGKGGEGGGGSSKGKGPGSAATRILVASVASAAVGQVIENSSTGSQSVGPPLSPVEMSCNGRNFNGANSLGAKLVPRTPLQFQLVAANDSVLGPWSNAPNNGLKCGTHMCTYRELIADAFGPALAADAENAFSRIWGQAIQAYESTLIPNQTPLDRYLAGDSNALTRTQERGFGNFKGKGGCTNCHSGPELTDASFTVFAANGAINEDGGDQGFHNIGVRPTSEDLGRAGLGPRGVPWSQSRSAFDRGAFKTPGLRNLKLTGPYMHNGGKATIADVVDFYARGGDFANPEKAKRMQKVSFSVTEKAELVDFLTNALTDCRVEKQRAPFDHPSLVVPNGPSLPAIGANGTDSCP